MVERRSALSNRDVTMTGATVKETEDGELYIDLPDELMEQMGWNEDTELVWAESEDGSWILKKKENDDTCNET
jgi:hypothetical protein